MVDKNKKRITIQKLYPNLSSKEQEEAEYNLRRYVRVVYRIYQRLLREGKLEEELKRMRLRKEWKKGSKKKN